MNWLLCQKLQSFSVLAYVIQKSFLGTSFKLENQSSPSEKLEADLYDKLSARPIIQRPIGNTKADQAGNSNLFLFKLHNMKQ